MALTLAQAAVLAAFLVPFGAITAGATPVTPLSCEFLATGGFTGCVTGDQGGAVYNYGDYALELRFDHVLQDFEVEFSDFHRTLDEMTSRFTGPFEGWQPVPICEGCTNDSGADAPYVDFVVTSSPEPQANVDFESQGARGFVPYSSGHVGYDLYIYWFADTNAGFPDPHIIHKTGVCSDNDCTADDPFDQEMTIPGSYFFGDPPSCVFDPDGCGSIGLASTDPGVGGRDNMFTDVTLANPTAVPEPASLLLLGSGISAMAYRRRRKKNS